MGNKLLVCFLFLINSTASFGQRIIPDNSYLKYQWYLDMNQFTTIYHTQPSRILLDSDIDMFHAWTMTKGNPLIRLGVIDYGLEDNHSGFDYNYIFRLSSNTGHLFSDEMDPHGTNCSGIMSGNHKYFETSNTIFGVLGVAGIAPYTTHIPISFRINKMQGSEIDRVALVNFISSDLSSINKIRVLNCSFSFSNEFDNFRNNISKLNNIDPFKSIIFVCAAGNSKSNSPLFDVRYPARFELDNVICVGASNASDTKASYSPINSRIDIVAPSSNYLKDEFVYNSLFPKFRALAEGIWTTDIMINDKSGLNPVLNNFNEIEFFFPDSPAGSYSSHYTSDYNGTSAAAPMVSATVGLMLSVNPFLTAAEVKSILQGSADKVGGYAYIDGRCDEMGYGRLNAFKAVSSCIPDSFSVNIDASRSYTIVPDTFTFQARKSIYVKSMDYNNKNVFLAGEEIHFRGDIRLLAEDTSRTYFHFRVDPALQSLKYRIVEGDPPSRWHKRMLRTTNFRQGVYDDAYSNSKKHSNRFLHVFPNPTTSNIFHVELVSDVVDLTQIKLFSITGVPVEAFYQINGNRVDVFVPGYKGILIVKYTNPVFSSTARVLLN